MNFPGRGQMGVHLVYLAVVAGLLSGLSVLLAQIGIAVCPILRSQSLLYGCSINLKYIVQFGFFAIPAGHLTLVLGGFKTRDRLRYDLSLVYLCIFIAAGVAWLFYLQMGLAATLGEHSPYGHSIAFALPLTGLAVLLLLVALLERLFAARHSSAPITEHSELRAKSEEAWLLSLRLFGPTMVFAFFIRFLVGVVEAGAEGWGTWSEVSGRIQWTGALFVLWYIGFLLLLRSAELKRLGDARALAIELGQGKFSGRVDLLRSGHLAPLFAALNQAGQNLKERSRLIEGFSRFVSSQLVEKVLSNETLRPEGQTVKCALMMSDIAGFTTLSAQLRADQVVHLLNIYFSSMIEIAVRHGIVIDKFIGDGILAYALHGPSYEPASQAVFDAAFDMLEAMPTVNAELRASGLPQISIRIGLHNGQAVLGSIGAEGRLQYTIIGDDVNRVARLEGAAKDKGVKVAASAAFWEALDTQRKGQLSGPLETKVKGIDEPLLIYTRI